MMKILILGGYGNFGARIARALAQDAGFDILIGGRNLARANDFARSLGACARGVCIDVESLEFPHLLRELAPKIVIHTAGPFQGQSYQVPLWVAAAGAHYIDLADGRRFVCDFAANVDAQFRRAGLSAISGASTVPALSAAVVDHLTAGWRSLKSIDTCIAPAQSAPRGKATLAGVLAYCGQPIRVLENGKWVLRPGWSSPTKVSFARMKPRRGALCDIPDLELFPERYRGVETVMFRAALEVGLAQHAFSALSFLRQRGFVSAPQKLASFMHSAGRIFDPLGRALGGMVVRVAGVNAEGHAVRRAWHIAADHDHGPEIPCMATILLARRLAKGKQLPIGANASIGLLALEEFAPEFARWRMVTDVVEE